MLLKAGLNEISSEKRAGRGSKIVIDIRSSIGIGEVEEIDNLLENNALPFVLSGCGLEILKDKSLYLGVFSDKGKVDDELNRLLEVYKYIG